MTASLSTDIAADPLPPKEAEFLTVLFQVRPEDRLEVLRELLAIAEAHDPATLVH